MERPPRSGPMERHFSALANDESSAGTRGAGAVPVGEVTTATATIANSAGSAIERNLEGMDMRENVRSHARRALPATGDHLDLDHRVLGKLLDADRGARGVRLAEALLVCGVHRREVRHVGEVHVALHH